MDILIFQGARRDYFSENPRQSRTAKARSVREGNVFSWSVHRGSPDLGLAAPLPQTLDWTGDPPDLGLDMVPPTRPGTGQGDPCPPGSGTGHGTPLPPPTPELAPDGDSPNWNWHQTGTPPPPTGTGIRTGTGQNWTERRGRYGVGGNTVHKTLPGCGVG